MADLSKFDKTDINSLIEKEHTTVSFGRPYLGMSSLGSECWRSLWFSFRWSAPIEISARLNRLFNVGHNAEPLLVADLESIGIKTHHTCADQMEFVAVERHCLGHPDGFGINIPEAPTSEHLLEFKTCNGKKFKEFTAKGCQETNYTYYCQCVLYMHMSETTRALFMVTNKEDSAYYFERINENKTLAKHLLQKAESIITSEDLTQFKRIANDSSFYKCKWCDYQSVCWQMTAPAKNCRTCKYADILPEGKWECSKHNKLLTTKKKDQPINPQMQYQEDGCSDHKYMPCFLIKQ